MAKLIESYGAEDKCDVLVVRKGGIGGPDGLYRATKITEESVILGYWYKCRESEWGVVYPVKEITREDVLCVVESVDEYRKLTQQWGKYRFEAMARIGEYVVEIAPIKTRYTAAIAEIKKGSKDRLHHKEEAKALLEKRKAEIEPIRARYETEYDELRKAHADRLNRLLGVKVF